MKLTKFRKGKLIGGIFAILFSIWHLLHSIFFGKVAINIYLSSTLSSSRDEVEKIKNLLENLNYLIYFSLILILLVVIILLFICHKKNGIKIIKKNEVNSILPIATYLIFAGIFLFVITGFTGLNLFTYLNDLIIFIGAIILIRA